MGERGLQLAAETMMKSQWIKVIILRVRRLIKIFPIIVKIFQISLEGRGSVAIITGNTDMYNTLTWTLQLKLDTGTDFKLCDLLQHGPGS